MLTNYHSHSNYCDGSTNLEEYILAAINLEFKAYGFSSHAPLPFHCCWAMQENQLKDYIRRIDYFKDKWQNEIQIFKSLEIDYIPDLTGPTSSLFQALDLDYTIGSIHFVEVENSDKPFCIDGSHRKFLIGLEKYFQGDVKKVVKKYYANTRKMVQEATPTIVGHLDKIKMHNFYQNHFDEKEDWYQEEIENTLNTIKTSGAFIEVNTRGFYKGKTNDLYPSTWILESILEKEIPIVLNSDSHMPEEINGAYDYALNKLINLGFTKVKNYNGEEWINTSIESLLPNAYKEFVKVEQIRK